MVRRALSAALALAVFASTTLAQKCSKDSKCPKDTPCCSLYGECGVGAFCMGGCDPLMSHSFDSCVPAPVCKSANYKFDDLNDIQSIDTYFGDASKVNWQSQGMPEKYDGSVLLTMAEGTVGTLLSSTHYVWYGKICAKMTTSQGKGVVTAFILMSDVKDEIDFEWIGVDVEHAQSNYYSQGVTNYKHGENLTASNTVKDAHEYCLDWTEDELTWSIDGNEARKLARDTTWNATANRFDYPQTPARIMLSLWPAGLATNEKGTIEWAGGEIDWHSKYMQNGYYYAEVKEVTVECYDAPPMAKKNGNKSYKYTDDAATNNTVEISNDVVVLGSLMGTGEEPGEASKSSDGPAPTKSVAMVPGGNPGGGNRQETAVPNSPAQQTGAGEGGPFAADPTAGGGGGSGQEFQQNVNGGSSIQPHLNNIGGSAFAIVIAVLGLLVL
ncbi:concanavalin A-like lectin/glucanase domain-containing protein [Massariosphaeria phaeospora]|uniref:Concanavalin A-like lectin/glucanase domain-containing protein n=1 Tax=Massariosphaeria phaeospora TaxID=100035 RepID=A0A7C8MB44_9PLEO|nr:concanavalin A-like lectin/glucanase domain-containing protein [Massariosphaeria phaeospora]